MKKYLSIGLVSLLVLFGLMVTNIAMAIPGTTLLDDNFGTGSAVRDIPNWDEEGSDGDGTTFAEEPSVSGENSASPAGGRFAKIGEDEWICREINATGYNNLNLSYYWRGDDDAENDDRGILEYKAGSGSCDTSGFTSLQNYDLSIDNSWSTQSVFSLPGGLDNTIFRLRFRAVSSSNDEYFRIDKVIITGNLIPDTTAPTTSVTSPDEGDYVRGTVAINANASDTGSGVARVEFWHSSPVGVKIGEDTSSSYSINWDTTGVLDGVHSIWTEAYDVAGNRGASSPVSVTVDNTAPTLYLSEDIVIEATGHSGEEVTFTASSTDNISPTGPEVTCVPPSGSTFTLGNTTVSCSATDTAGNTATDTFLVTIEDTTDPEITAPGDQTFEATGPITSPTELIIATATDIADASLDIDSTPTSFGLGTTEVLWTATDDSGNTATATSNVTIIDTTAPVITLNGNNPFALRKNNDYATYNPDPDYTVFDLVDGDDVSGDVVVTVTGKDFDNTVLGEHIITYTAVDLSGNQSSIDRTVNVVNNDRPIIYRIGGSPLTVEGGSTYTDLGATAVDRDESDITSSIITTGSPEWPINTMVLGLKEIYYNVTGADLGTTTTTDTNIADQAKRVVNVVDTTAPVITVDPLTVGLLVGDSYDVMSGVGATDIIDLDLTSSIVTGGTYTDTSAPGSYTITYNVVDTAGNHAIEVTRTVNIEVPDTTDPLVTSVQAIDANTIEVSFNEELQNNTSGHYPGISDFDAYDSKDGGHNSYGISNVSYSDKKVTITLSNPLKSGDLPRLYIVPGPVSLVDLSGNYYNDAAPDDKEVTDKIIPVITLIGNATIDLTVGDSYTDAGATVIDIVDASTTVTTSGTVDANTVGTYTIKYNAVDASGNQAEEVTRTVNVNEQETTGGGSSGSRGNHTGSGTTNPPTDENPNEGLSDDNLTQLLGLLTVLGSQAEGEANPLPPVNVPELIPEQEGGANPGAVIEGGETLPPTVEEVAGATTTGEENGLPLSAAVGSVSGFSFSWWWVVVIIVIGGVLYFIYRKKV